MFLNEAEVRSLVLRLMSHFPGTELVLDAFTPFCVWANHRRLARTGVGARCHWALKRAEELESWDDGIRLLGRWFPFAQPEPRLAHVKRVRHIPLLARATGVHRYRLGQAAR